MHNHSAQTAVVIESFPIDHQAHLSYLPKVCSIQKACLEGYQLCLDYQDQLTQLHQLKDLKTKPINGKRLIQSWIQRLKTQGQLKQPLAKALGIKGHRIQTPKRVLDLTAGFARDAVCMAQLGCEVHMIEQAAPMVLLLEEALAILNQETSPWLDGLKSRLKLYPGNFIHQLDQGLLNQINPHAVYYDPMFEPSAKTALAKSDLQCLQALVGYESTPMDWLKHIEHSKARLIVKRHTKAVPRLQATEYNQAPTFQLKSKRFCLDVYDFGTHNTDTQASLGH